MIGRLGVLHRAPVKLLGVRGTPYCAPSPRRARPLLLRGCVASSLRGFAAEKRHYQTKPVENGVHAGRIRTYEKMPSKKRSQLKVKRTQRENAPLPNEPDGISRKELSQQELAQNAPSKTNPIRSRPAPPSPSLSRRAGIDSWLPNKRCISKRTHREIHKSRWTKELRKMSTERKAKQSHRKPTLPSAPTAYGLQPIS